jgi:hypothetical protein
MEYQGVTSKTVAPTTPTKGNSTAKTIKGQDLSNLFGIEIEETVQAALPVGTRPTKALKRALKKVAKKSSARRSRKTK